MFQLPQTKDVIRQEDLALKDLPARSFSVLMVIGLCVFHLPLQLVLSTAAAYVCAEICCIILLRLIIREMTWPRYIGLLLAAFAATALFLRIPYEMWQLGGLSPRIFAFCTLTTALIHCAVKRSYHMPFALVTGLPVIYTIAITVVFTFLNKERFADAFIGIGIVGVMVSYISVMIVQGHRGRQALIRARKAADAANAAKGRFLASMTHEIRTPLNGILGVARLIQDAAQSQDAREQADVLLSSAQSLKILVDDALDHAKVEAGKLTLRPAPSDISATAYSVVRLFESLADEKGIKLSLSLDDKLPPLLHIDPVRVRQILSNLISNAIKFTDKGEVEVRISAGPLNARHVPLTISVRDTGAGVSSEDQRKLFEFYSQVDSKAERAAAGTGLGLAISQNLAELMGGSIVVQSELGEGSLFSFTFSAELAVERRGPSDLERIETDGLSNLRILVVDDSKSNRYIVRAFLKDTGAVVAEVDDGQKAVSYAQDVAFDVILMDLYMPVLGGMEAFKQIRDGGGKSASASIVALTGDGTDDDREAAFDAGMDGFLSKPLSKEALIAELSRHAVSFGSEDSPDMVTGPKREGASP